MTTKQAAPIVINRERQPVRWATYNGDVPLDLYAKVGPNTAGEYLWPVHTAHDAIAGTTRVGFSYIAPPSDAS